MTNGFRGLLVGGGEPIYVKLKEVEKLAVRHFKKSNIIIDICFFSDLKELYTSETTLAQKIVLTPLNNKFELKI